MMCGHCEVHVKRSLESLPFVTSVEVSHVLGNAVVELQNAPANVNTELRKAVESGGYIVKSID